jgi:antimicrobial peptide system SdpA family protein
MNNLENKKGLRRAGAVLVAAVVTWGALGIYAVHACMPYNPIKLPAERALDIRILAPEGWKFFTRDPQEEAAYAFRAVEDGSFAPVPRDQNASSANLFGASRTGRLRGVEMGTLLEQIPDTDWTKCDEAPAKCLARAKSVATVKNGATSPTMCGSIGIALQKPVPWAWARSKRPVTMPSRVARVVVTC